LIFTVQSFLECIPSQKKIGNRSSKSNSIKYKLIFLSHCTWWTTCLVDLLWRFNLAHYVDVVNDFLWFKGPILFKCTKILSQCNPFVYYLLSFFYHVKTLFCIIMMESKNCSGLKYGTYEIFDIFWLITFNWDQNIGIKKTIIRTKSFSS